MELGSRPSRYDVRICLKSQQEFGSRAAPDETNFEEQVSFRVSTTKDQPVKYYLVEVVYFANAGSSYTGTIQF